MLKSFTVAAAVAGVLATASPASAAASPTSDELYPPGNCPQGVFCIWPEWNPWGTPTLVTGTDWSGEVPGLYFYNRTSRSVDVTFSWTVDTSGRMWTSCVDPGSGGDTYWHGNVTQVILRTSSCT